MSITMTRGVALAVIAAGTTIASTALAQAASYPTQYASQNACVESRVQPGLYVPALDEEWCITFNGKQGIRKAVGGQPGLAVRETGQPGLAVSGY
ncbi:hypothetical protein [Rhodococcus triatomae]